MGSTEARDRERAADEITDIHRGISAEQIETLVLTLVAATLNETVHAAQEAQLHALIELRAAHRLDTEYFRPLIALKGRLPAGYADYLDDLVTDGSA